jgi:hypothetical protein
MPIIGVVIVVMLSMYIIRVSRNSTKSIMKIVIGIIVILGLIGDPLAVFIPVTLVFICIPLVVVNNFNKSINKSKRSKNR